MQIWNSTLFSLWKRDVQNIHERNQNKNRRYKGEKKAAKHCKQAYDTLHRHPVLFLSLSNYYEISWCSSLRDASHPGVQELTLYVVKKKMLSFYRQAHCLTETKELVELIKLKIHILFKTMTSTRWFSGSIFLVPLLLTSDLKHVSYINYLPHLRLQDLWLFLIHINNISAMQKDYWKTLQKT